jgi:hypothetical protein
MSAHGDVKEEERCKYVVMRIAKDVGFFHSERD